VTWVEAMDITKQKQNKNKPKPNSRQDTLPDTFNFCVHPTPIRPTPSCYLDIISPPKLKSLPSYLCLRNEALGDFQPKENLSITLLIVVPWLERELGHKTRMDYCGSYNMMKNINDMTVFTLKLF
jgi:hypothetical protein